MYILTFSPGRKVVRTGSAWLGSRRFDLLEPPRSSVLVRANQTTHLRDSKVWTVLSHDFRCVWVCVSVCVCGVRQLKSWWLILAVITSYFVSSFTTHIRYCHSTSVLNFTFFVFSCCTFLIAILGNLWSLQMICTIGLFGECYYFIFLYQSFHCIYWTRKCESSLPLLHQNFNVF
jgi:hypothetical protein